MVRFFKPVFILSYPGFQAGELRTFHNIPGSIKNKWMALVLYYLNLLKMENGNGIFYPGCILNLILNAFQGN
jgi:hypothetical protein